MKLELEVLASTTIRRKKPWPRVVWLGEQKESLLLLDSARQRTSVLYVPSGKTKRKIPKLAPFLEDLVVITPTRNGHYLVGLQETGVIFLWHKDQDNFRIISGFSQYVTKEYLRGNRVRLYPSNDCRHVLVVVGVSNFYLWEASGGLADLTIGELHGVWHQVAPPPALNFPPSESPECCTDAVFYRSQVLGDIFQCSVAFNVDSSLHLVTLVLRLVESPDTAKRTGSDFSIEWSELEYSLASIQPDCQPINSLGSYVMSYATDGQVIAIAANQKSAGMNSVLFVSPLIKSVLVADMKGCGQQNVDQACGRLHWVTDLTWTSDGLFVACMLSSGSVCVLSRLGGPLVLQTTGCSVNMGPAYFLPLHPVVMLNGVGEVSPSPSVTNQLFSVSTHPSLPILLFSDGFLVTVVQIAADIDSCSMMREEILEASRHLKCITDIENLDVTLADAYKVHSVSSKSVKSQLRGGRSYAFEPEDYDSAQESEDSFFEADDIPGTGAIGKAKSGRIMFGESEIITQLNNTFSGQDVQEQLRNHLEISQHALLNAWKLSVCYPELWNSEVEELAKQVVWNTSKLFTVVLDTVTPDSAMLKVLSKQPSASVSTGLAYLLRIVQQFFNLLQFDMVNQNLLPVAYRLVHQVLGSVLTSDNLKCHVRKLKIFSECYKLLKIAEKTFNMIYVWMPRKLYTDILSTDLQGRLGHRYEPAISIALQANSKKLSKNNRDREQEQTPGKRLCASWELLCRSVVAYHTSLSTQRDADGELEQISQMLYNIQKKIHSCDGQIPVTAAPNSNQGDKLSLEGLHTRAVDFWTEQLKALPGQDDDGVKAGRLLHSVLYTYLLRGALRMAVDFVDSLILRATVTSPVSMDTAWGGEGEELALMTMVVRTIKSQDSGVKDAVPCIRDRTIRQLVQTMARFMLAYFSNLTVYIFPPHNPQPLPTVHMGPIKTNTRIIPIYHEDLTNTVRREGLGGVWSTERTVEYLLLSGLVCEGTWFADKMGDWKTAFQLAVACSSHRSTAPQLYRKPKKPLQLPETLSPEFILKRKLEVLVHFDEDRAITSTSLHVHPYSDLVCLDDEPVKAGLVASLRDMFLAGTMCGVDLAPWLLATLVDKLKRVVSHFPPLVPQDFGLPAPPPYCLQTDWTFETDLSTDLHCERQLRYKAAFLTKLVLAVLEAGRLSLTLARWYLQDLYRVQDKAAQFKSTTECPCLELPDVLQQYNLLRSTLATHQRTAPVQQILGAFRDFTTIMWLMHVRDELSYNLKQRHDFLSQVNYEDYVRASWEAKEVENWLQHCFTTLRWAVNMLAFSHFLPDRGSTHKVILSLLLELPTSEDTADILAEHFSDRECLDPDVQEKLERLLGDWQGVSIIPEDDGKSAKLASEEVEEDGDVRKSVTFFQASPRGEMLSVYFHKQCEVISKVFRKRRKVFGRYDQFVFSSDEPSDTAQKEELKIGSRPYETRQSFFEFLARFFDLSFTKLAGGEGQTNSSNSLPLLCVFSKEVSSKEFQKHAARKTESVNEKRSLVVMASPRVKPGRTNSDSYTPPSVKPAPSQSKHKGLFRSVSSGNAGYQHHASEMSFRRYNSEDIVRYDSEDILMPIHEDGHNISPSSDTSPKRGRGNMTSLASKFSQSEEVLYRNPTGTEEHVGVLDVDFGQKYQPLVDLLDWLVLWCKKPHRLQLHQSETHEQRPIMKLDIPAQLVVLSLWLLERKYTGSSGRGSVIPYTELLASLPVEESLKGGKLGKKESAQSKKMSDRFTSGEKDLGVPNVSPKVLRKQLSLQSTQDREDIKSAYEKVLDGVDDESSLELSSLGSEELEEGLKRTLSLVRAKTEDMNIHRQLHGSSQRDNTALNKTWHFESPTLLSKTDSKVPEADVLYNLKMKRNDPRHRKVSPERVTNRQSAAECATDKNDSSSANRSTRHSASQVDPTHVTKPMQLIGANPGHATSDNLALQLQEIIRGEFRRIMEAQHHTLMTMLGAVDGPPPVVSPWQQVYPANQLAVLPKHHQEVQAGATLEETLASLVSENTDSLGSQKMKKKSRKQPKKNKNVLRELENLQQRTTRKKQSSKSPQNTRRTLEFDKENYYGFSGIDKLTPDADREYAVYHSQRQSGADVNLIPKFLRIAAEKDTSDIQFKLPRIPPPFQAWTEDGERNQNSNVAPMPLLHLEEGKAPSGLFKGLFRVPGTVSQQFSSPRVPSQEPHYSGAQPPTQYPPRQAELPPPRQVEYPPPRQPILPPSGDTTPVPVSMPLLQLPVESRPFLTHARPGQFGRLVPPHLLVAHEQELHQQELLKQKYARDFHKLQVENLEELEKQKFGENLLQVNLKVQKMKEQKAAEKRRRRRKKLDELAESQTESEIEKHEKAVLTSPVRRRDAEVQPSGGSAEETEDRSPGSGDDHHGYAIKPGTFDAYLDQAEALGAPVDTNARVQYEAAKAMEALTQRHAPIKVQRDAWVGSDEPLPVQGTDKGVDPIQEALIEYNQSRQGHMLPPDIYMGLRFGEAGDKPSTGIAHDDTAPVDGRNYLNVIDVNASTILKDLKDSADNLEVQPDMTLKSTDYTQSAARRANQADERMGAMEETWRESLLPERPETHDAVTVKMFQTNMMGRDSVSVALMPRESMTLSKSAMLRGLQNMDHQMAALDQMSHDMQRDFQNTRLLLHTVERLGEAGVEEVRSPIQSDKPPVLSTRMSAQPGKTITFQDQKKSSDDPVVMSTDLVGMSGLSGVSDIIHEMVAHGDIDLQEAGFSERDIRALTSGRSEMDSEQVRESVDKLRQMARERTESPDPVTRRSLLAWMADKRSKQQDEYRKKRGELREREVQPFSKKGQIPQPGLTTKQLHQNARLKEETRKVKMSENMDRRMRDAELLLGDILVDTPRLPQSAPPERDTPRKRSALPSPDRAGMGWTRTVETAKRQGILKPSREYSPHRQYFETGTPTREITQDMDRTGDTTGELNAYYAQTFKSMDTSLSQEFRLADIPSRSPSPDETEPRSPGPQPVSKPYKPKSFDQLVRLQRPEITRKKQQGFMQLPMSETGVEAESARDTHRETSREEQEKIYGSKRLPGRKVAPHGVRAVKTYAERLQEMKSNQTYDTPIVPRVHHAGSRQGSSITSHRTSQSHQPPHKPVSYVQRLQNLNKGTKRTRGVPVGRQTYVLKSTKPPHKPQTYVEQLKSLQDHAPRGSQSKMLRVSGGKALPRPRPYGDPYRSGGWEEDSVLSDWSVDDKVRQLLYEDEPSRREYAGTDGVSDYFDVVMENEEVYTGSVDIAAIRQIADAVSVSSGSVMSVIDWDAVDNLIADVQ
ncbi:hypothetical protein ScPMuIL_002064 [Solemya velum]